MCCIYATHFPLLGTVSARGPFLRGRVGSARALHKPLWASEDYSTYSDATGAGCWGRLLVQNLNWQFTATISW